MNAIRSSESVKLFDLDSLKSHQIWSLTDSSCAGVPGPLVCLAGGAALAEGDQQQAGGGHGGLRIIMDLNIICFKLVCFPINITRD